MEISLNMIADWDRIVTDSAKRYLINSGKIVRNSSNTAIYFAGHKDITFTLEEIKDIDSDEKYNAFIESKQIKEEVVEEKKEPTEIEQVDMLVNTGYTGAIPTPITTNVQEKAPEVPKNEGVVVTPIVETPLKAEPVLDQSPEMMPLAKDKTMTLTKKEAGFSDVILISIIVIVYIAIIVNLVIRLK